jgi:hypothetical protein
MPRRCPFGQPRRIAAASAPYQWLPARAKSARSSSSKVIAAPIGPGSDPTPLRGGHPGSERGVAARLVVGNRSCGCGSWERRTESEDPPSNQRAGRPRRPSSARQAVDRTLSSSPRLPAARSPTRAQRSLARAPSVLKPVCFCLIAGAYSCEYRPDSPFSCRCRPSSSSSSSGRGAWRKSPLGDGPISSGLPPRPATRSAISRT